jgi:hypothetical protein
MPVSQTCHRYALEGTLSQGLHDNLEGMRHSSQVPRLTWHPRDPLHDCNGS